MEKIVKIVIPVCLTAMVLTSCVEEKGSCKFDGDGIVFFGYAYGGTRVSVGENDGEAYPLVWASGDVICIYSSDGVYDGERADVYSKSVGSPSGYFQPENDLIPEADMDLVITYPGKKISYSDGVITGTVAPVQTQPSANNGEGVGDCCIAYAQTSVKTGQKDDVTFTLNHTTAFVKVMVGKISGYEDCSIASVSLTAEGADLAGDISYNISTGRMTVTDGSSSVVANISDMSAVLSEDEAVYLAVLPTDLTGMTMTVEVNMMSSYDNATTFTEEIEGFAMQAGSVYVIEVNTDEYSWYSASDARDLLGGYAYGPQNTYYIEQPETGSGHVSIDVRARGDMSKVTKPKYYGLVAGSSDRSASDYSSAPNDVGGNQKLIYLPDGTDDHQDIPTNEVNGDYTIDVYCYPQGTGYEGNWSVVGIYDEDYDLLWSFMVCKYLPGDELSTVTYSDGKQLLDRVLGSPYSFKVAEQKGDFGQPAAAYFQWGRKDPFPWFKYSTYGVEFVSEAHGVGATIEDGIKNPTTAFGGSHDWLGLDYTQIDLWGVSEMIINSTMQNAFTRVGHKTVYDPCPEGYRVMDPSFILPLFNEEYERWEYDSGYGDQLEEYINMDSPFLDGNYSVWATQLPDGTYDYWPWFGFIWNNSASWSKSDTWARKTAMGYWSCASYNDSANGGDGFGCRPRYDNGKYSTFAGLGKELGMCVRCQKE